jgi:formate/nitrite transporter FocA (FNT family)
MQQPLAGSFTLYFSNSPPLYNILPANAEKLMIGIAKTSGTFLKTFIKGIGANWLGCIAVWVAYKEKYVAGKIISKWFPVMCFVAFGFEHIIANMFFIPTAMLLDADINLYQFLALNLLLATLGNIVGGAVFVA